MGTILEKIKNIANKHKTPIYLTGGAVRDIILGNEVNDYDFTVKNNVKKISVEFAEMISGTHLELDEKNKIYRVVKNNIDYDFTALRGDNIKNDLAKRDFTINSMVIKHNNFEKIKINDKKYDINQNILIDPYQGINDLKNCLIRVVNKNAFSEDPIRLLRAIRFKAILDFNIEKNTEKLIYSNRKLIKKTAAERIRYELIKIFNAKNTDKIVKYMENKVNIFSVVFPEVKKLKNSNSLISNKINNWQHVLDMLSLYKKISEDKIINCSPKNKNKAIFKFAIIFHEYNNIKINNKRRDVEKIFRDLKFSNNEVEYIKKLTKYYIKVFSLYNDQNLTDSKIYDFFKEVENFAEDILFLATLKYESMTKMEDKNIMKLDFFDFIKELLNKYKNMISSIKNPLLTGQEIMKVLDIEEGPLVGKYLDKIKKEQALGKIDKKFEAIFYLNNLEINEDNNS